MEKIQVFQEARSKAGHRKTQDDTAKYNKGWQNMNNNLTLPVENLSNIPNSFVWDQERELTYECPHDILSEPRSIL